MGLDVTYKGQQIAQLTQDGSLTLSTAGTYCEDNIDLTYSGGGGGGAKIGRWTRPDYMPDITDYVLEQEDTCYISIVNTAENQQDTNSRIAAPLLSKLKVVTFHEGGTTTEQVVVDYGFDEGSYSYIFMSKLPLGKLLLIIQTRNGVTSVPRNDYGTNINFYELYCFGKAGGTVGTECRYPFERECPERIVLKNIRFVGALRLSGALVTATLPNRILKSAECYDCDFSSVTSLYTFSTLNTFTAYYFDRLNISVNCTNFAYAFSEICNEKLDLSNCDLSGATVTTGMFRQYQRQNPQLSNMTMFKAPKISFDVSPLINLTKASLLSIINALQPVASAQTLTLGAVNKAKLTAEEIAVATAKGWTVA